MCVFVLLKPSLTTKHDVDLVFFDDGRRLTPQTFFDLAAGNRASECIARGGPCATQEGWGLFMTHFDVHHMDQSSLPNWMRAPSERS